MTELTHHRETPSAREIGSMILTHFWFKTFGTTAYTFLFFVCYLYLLKNPSSATATIPLTWLDQAIAFQPLALPAYLSLWVYVSTPPMLMVTREQIISYGARISVPCLIAFAIFYFWPNAVPLTNIDWAQYPGVAFLKKVDAAGNACPSLHVATAVFTAMWLHWRFQSLNFAPIAYIINIAWCAAIAYSTLATKQHVALDVLTGTLLGAGGAWLTNLKHHAQSIRHK